MCTGCTQVLTGLVGGLIFLCLFLFSMIIHLLAAFLVGLKPGLDKAFKK